MNELNETHGGGRENLPFALWLAGDEPYFGDFCLDADEVMKRLHIKRTRLTQISGRELRVGRMRMGRYIKPFYREIDVEDYLGLSKAPQTAMKQKEIISEAQKQLAEVREEFVTTWTEPMLALKKEMNKKFVAMEAELCNGLRSMEKGLGFLRREIEAKRDDQSDALGMLSVLFERLESWQMGRKERDEDVRGELQSFKGEISEIKSALENLEEISQAGIADLKTRFRFASKLQRAEKGTLQNPQAKAPTLRLRDKPPKQLPKWSERTWT